MNTPLISIITITMNSERFLEQTITSVVNQTYNNIEYIVVDGGSRDGTLEIIKRYESRIAKWLSEPDQGISDAMNKGLRLATGDFVLFLHSDDYLCSDSVLSEAVQQMIEPVDLYLFDIILVDNDHEQYIRSRGFSWRMYFKTGVAHQSAICSRKLFQEIGEFNTGLKIAMDYDFFLRAYRAGMREKCIALPLSYMRLCGISNQRDWGSLRKRFAEERAIHTANCSSLWQWLIYQFYWPIYLSYRRIVYYTQK